MALIPKLWNLRICLTSKTNTPRPEAQIGFKQGNFGGTSSVEMKDSLADDSARLEKDSKKMNDLSVEGAAFAEDNDTTPKYQEVPENQTYP